MSGALCSSALHRLDPTLRATSYPTFVIYCSTTMPPSSRSRPIDGHQSIAAIDLYEHPRIALRCPPPLRASGDRWRSHERPRARARHAATASDEIDLLREYRTRLIADVVTGKLDVREAAARLPDEAEEPEPLDDGRRRELSRDGRSESEADSMSDTTCAALIVVVARVLPDYESRDTATGRLRAGASWTASERILLRRGEGPSSRALRRTRLASG